MCARVVCDFAGEGGVCAASWSGTYSGESCGARSRRAAPAVMFDHSDAPYSHLQHQLLCILKLLRDSAVLSPRDWPARSERAFTWSVAVAVWGGRGLGGACGGGGGRAWGRYEELSGLEPGQVPRPGPGPAAHGRRLGSMLLRGRFVHRAGGAVPRRSAGSWPRVGAMAT